MCKTRTTGPLIMHFQQTSTNTPPAAPPATPRSQSAELRNQIRETVIDAQNAARDAALAGQDAARAGTEAVIASQGAATGNVRVSGRGVTIVPPGLAGYDANNAIPQQAVDISLGFFIMVASIAVGWPLARAFGRRIERKSEMPAVNSAMSGQLLRIEQAIDAMSIEVERISESQRFLAKLQSGQSAERVALPADRS